MSKYIIRDVDNPIFISFDLSYTSNPHKAAKFRHIGDAMRVAIAENERIKINKFKIIKI